MCGSYVQLPAAPLLTPSAAWSRVSLTLLSGSHFFVLSRQFKERRVEFVGLVLFLQGGTETLLGNSDNTIRFKARRLRAF